MRSRVPDGYKSRGEGTPSNALYGDCLLYTSDAADE